MKNVKNFYKRAESIGKILFLSCIVTAVLLLIFALLARAFALEGKALGIGISVVYVVSCLIGGFLTGKIMGNRKFLWGLLLGILYFAVVFACSSFVETPGSRGCLWNLLLCLGGGMLGGMVS